MGLDWIADALEDLRRRGRLRDRRDPFVRPGPWLEGADGRRLLNLCSNDYLSLSGEPASGASGAGASRLVGGELSSHRRLEQALADWLCVEDALLFSSGYGANVGAVAALSGPGAVVVSDAWNHASLIDGCRLSRARVVVVPHGAVEVMRRALLEAPEPKRLLVTDGYFSMDGELAPLGDLRRICDEAGAMLYVDEAHGLGVFGPGGRGCCAAAGIVADVRMGTLGKAFGVSGAFVAGRAKLTHWLWNMARSFVFSTGVSPVLADAALASLGVVQAGERTSTLWKNVEILRRALRREGVSAGSSVGPILPLVLGSEDAALRASGQLLEENLFVHPIRPPTVPPGTSRLRITVQAGHGEADLVAAAAALAKVTR